MTRASAFCAAALLLAGTTGCASGASPLWQSAFNDSIRIAGNTRSQENGSLPVRPPAALIEVYSAPAQTNFDATRLGPRRASGKIFSIRDPYLTGISFLTVGDASVRKSAEDAGIRKVSHIDYRLVNVLGICLSLEVIVFGE